MFSNTFSEKKVTNLYPNVQHYSLGIRKKKLVILRAPPYLMLSYLLYAILITSNISSRQVVLTFLCFLASLLGCHKCWPKSHGMTSVFKDYGYQQRQETSKIMRPGILILNIPLWLAGIKGQLISKASAEICQNISQLDLKTPKFHSEINQPLIGMKKILNIGQSCTNFSLIAQPEIQILNEL